MRAVTPIEQGHVEVHGVRVGFEVFGHGDPALLFLTCPIVESRCWKAQVPYFARSHRVVTVDPRGNGRSDRPTDPAAFTDDELVADALAVMDATDLDRAVLVGLCSSGWIGWQVAARHPERVLALVHVTPGVPLLSPPHPHRIAYDFDERLDTTEGWAKQNRHYWTADWPGFVDFFFGQLLPEPHSTKQLEDATGWARQTTAAVVLAEHDAFRDDLTLEDVEKVLADVSCPALLIAGDRDQCQPLERAQRLAEVTGARLAVLEGAGHLPMAREPVIVNRLIRDLLDALPAADGGGGGRAGAGGASGAEAPPTRRWTRSLQRPKRVLYLSSPIGLGHGRRDLAIARALHERRPDVEVHWLAQHPVTELLRRAGEHVHPASAALASESAHVEEECGEHDLHAFQAIRRMDEILAANFMVFHDLVEEQHYDAWLVDEGWDVDYFLHENPELKRAPYVWMTDFVGWIPMAHGGRREAQLTADANAEMLEHIDRLPWVRDAAVFVGDPADVVPLTFGEGLPAIRDWCADHFSFTGGYITGFDPPGEEECQEVRRRFGIRPDERLCVVTVGGSGVGRSLLSRVAAAAAALRRAVPDLRLLLVTGPRIDPASVTAPAGVDVVGFLPDLHRVLAACDVAVVQGGLTTTMELVAARRPFVYVPLRNHFEQQHHVRHRLQRYGAGRALAYEDADPDALAAAVADELRRPVRYLPVDNGGAGRVADLVAGML